MTEDGLFVEATNSVAKKWFRGIDELLVHDQLKHRMLSNLLVLACVRPRGCFCFFFNSVAVDSVVRPIGLLTLSFKPNPDQIDGPHTPKTGWWRRRTGSSSTP